jgi:hypothetical protein
MSKFVVPFFCYRLFPFEQSILDLCMCLFYVLFQHTFTQVFPSAKIGRSAVVIPFYKKNSRYLLSLRLIRLVMFVVSCWKLLFLLIVLILDWLFLFFWFHVHHLGRTPRKNWQTLLYTLHVGAASRYANLAVFRMDLSPVLLSFAPGQRRLAEGGRYCP